MGTRAGIVIAAVLVIIIVGYFGFFRPSNTQTAAVAPTAATEAAPAPLASAVPPFAVDPGKPFGDLDISPVRSQPAKAIASWVAGLTSAQQTDLNTRCEYMLGREGDYRVDDLTFCQQWQFGRSL
jgi:hypothetical protein